MNDAVIPEMELLAFSVAAGGLCFLGYDLLLVLRTFLKRPMLLEKAEDIIYWTIASVLVFSMIHQKNSGVIRGYSIAGMLAGMLTYRGIMKERLVLGAGCLAKKIGKWGRKRLEPLKKRKKELQNKRKQIKIEREQVKAKRKQVKTERKQVKKIERKQVKIEGKQVKIERKQKREARKNKKKEQGTT